MLWYHKHYWKCKTRQWKETYSWKKYKDRLKSTCSATSAGMRSVSLFWTLACGLLSIPECKALNFLCDLHYIPGLELQEQRIIMYISPKLAYFISKTVPLWTMSMSGFTFKVLHIRSDLAPGFQKAANRDTVMITSAITRSRRHYYFPLLPAQTHCCRYKTSSVLIWEQLRIISIPVPFQYYFFCSFSFI